MKKFTIEQKFSGYKSITHANLDSIKGLINQSNMLAELINEVDDPDSKENIVKIRKQINNSIEELLVNTRIQFAAYKELANRYADKVV